MEMIPEICPACRLITSWDCDDDYYRPSSTCQKCGGNWDESYLTGWQECYHTLKAE
jgi:hypothetical protein